MTKLYISGAIAADPDFKQKFKDWQIKLEAAGFLTVNPVEVDPCLDQACGGEIIDTDPEDGETITEYRHTWSCYMKYDLVAMLQCDGVAALPDAVESPGGRAEMYLAGLVGIPVKPIRSWVVESIKEQIAQPIVATSEVPEEYLRKMDEAVYASIGFTVRDNYVGDTGGLDTTHTDEKPARRCLGCGHYEDEGDAPAGCISGVDSHSFVSVDKEGVIIEGGHF